MIQKVIFSDRFLSFYELEKGTLVVMVDCVPARISRPPLSSSVIVDVDRDLPNFGVREMFRLTGSTMFFLEKRSDGYYLAGCGRIRDEKYVISEYSFVYFLPYFAPIMPREKIAEVVRRTVGHALSRYFTGFNLKVDVSASSFASSSVDEVISSVFSVYRTIRKGEDRVHYNFVRLPDGGIYEMRLMRFKTLTHKDKMIVIHSPIEIAVFRQVEGPFIVALTPVMHPFINSEWSLGSVCTNGKRDWESIEAIIEHPKIDEQSPFHSYEKVKKRLKEVGVWFTEVGVEDVW